MRSRLDFGPVLASLVAIIALQFVARHVVAPDGVTTSRCRDWRATWIRRKSRRGAR